jgi:hypothetical protein
MTADYGNTKRQAVQIVVVGLPNFAGSKLCQHNKNVGLRSYYILKKAEICAATDVSRDFLKKFLWKKTRTLIF